MLDAALEQVEFWDRYVGTREFASRAAWELQNMLLVSRLLVAAAEARRESRASISAAIIPRPTPTKRSTSRSRPRLDRELRESC